MGEFKYSTASFIWLGANDNATESQWVWQTGPEAGNNFWTGYTNNGTGPGTGSGATVNGGYANWGADHLNDWGGVMMKTTQLWSLKSSSGNYYPNWSMDGFGSCMVGRLQICC